MSSPPNHDQTDVGEADATPILPDEPQERLVFISEQFAFPTLTTMDWAELAPLHALAFAAKPEFSDTDAESAVMAGVMMTNDAVERQTRIVLNALSFLGLYWSPELRAEAYKKWHAIEDSKPGEEVASLLSSQLTRLQHISQYSDYLSASLRRAVTNYQDRYQEDVDARIDLYAETAIFEEGPLLRTLWLARRKYEDEASTRTMIIEADRVARLMILEELAVLQWTGQSKRFSD